MIAKLIIEVLIMWILYAIYMAKHGFLEVLPICCGIDYITTEYSHGILHRDYTLASGGNICDYWIVPDQIKNPI